MSYWLLKSQRDAAGGMQPTLLSSNAGKPNMKPTTSKGRTNRSGNINMVCSDPEDSGGEVEATISNAFRSGCAAEQPWADLTMRGSEGCPDSSQYQIISIQVVKWLHALLLPAISKLGKT